MSSRRWSLQIEALESRALLATAGVQTLALSGEIRATYVLEHPGSPNGGALRIMGGGTVSPLGRFHASGHTALGPGAGTLTLTNARGRLALRLKGTDFTIAGGTGAYRGATGQGALAGLPMQPSRRGSVVLRLQPVVSPPVHGTVGIAGQVLRGPTIPVERPGESDTAPLPGATLSIEPAGGGSEVARVQSDAAGNFQVDLPPGDYLIVALPMAPGRMFPRPPSPQAVTVPAQGSVTVTIEYDTGIR
jgi:hypothetical protein